VHFVGLFFVFIIENARSKKQNRGCCYALMLTSLVITFIVHCLDLD